ncbi:MAG TPA: DNA-directed RNA polymerase subunit beta', partial [Bryobacteraceae bacterium]|nr:DNA-directed RNA polymerase subunit beta' [Bryobacteraceae bacterium]
AQSIGEPGTQLTMRTFHVGGTATGSSEQSKQDANSDGFIKFLGVTTVRNAKGELIAMNRNGILAIIDDKGREKERYPVVYGAKVLFEDGAKVKNNDILLEWDPYTFSILTEVSGKVHFKDLSEGITLQEQVDEITGMSQWVVTDSPDEKRIPTVIVRPEGGSRSDEKRYLMPTHAHLMVTDGEDAHAGDVIAKIPRATTKTKDITGGLPRVVELFEARKPRETAIIAEINGVVKYGEVAKGMRKISITADDGEQKDYAIPRGVHINVQEGERVKAGDPLMDGPRNPHDILAVLGEKELQKYLVNEIQEVYRLQGVNINDKHLEVISRQMMRWVKVDDIGDTEFLPEEVVDKFKFREENARVVEAGGRPATGKPVLLGITKASLSTDSFISAASFQETTRVLTEAAINGKVDYLRGLKENVIMGRLIPAGTGMEYYRGVKIAGEDVVEEEPIAEEVSLAGDLGGYEDEARTVYTGGLTEEAGEETTLAE